MENKEFRILPVLTSGDLAALGHEAVRLQPVGALHIDIEDGNFSPGITVGVDTVRCVRRYTDAEIDVHLMVTDPEFYIDDLAACGVNAVAAHIESTLYPSRFLNQIRKAGMKAGLALNYKTPVDAVAPYLDLAEYILLETSESDRAGVGFKPYSFERLRALRALLPAEIEIWVDGGVDDGNIEALAKAGADCAAVGRAVFSADDPVQKARDLAKRARKAKEEAL